MLRTTVAAAVLLLAGTAYAEQFKFTYSEQDFVSPEAVAQLHERMKASARSYCNKEYFKARYLNQINGCVEDLISQLAENIDERRIVAQVWVTDQRES